MNIYYSKGSLFHLIPGKLTEDQLKYREAAQKAYTRYEENHKAVKHFYYNTDSDTIIPKYIQH